MGLIHPKAGYLAGMIDADGHITWRAGKNASPDVGVTNTSDALMKWLVASVGGAYALQRCMCQAGCRREHVHRRADIYKWHVTGYRAVVMLRNIRPHLVVKGDRADGVIRRFEEHLEQMRRPARRLHHIAKEAAAMAANGWD